jgi:hypothetical protein
MLDPDDASEQVGTAATLVHSLQSGHEFHILENGKWFPKPQSRGYPGRGVQAEIPVLKKVDGTTVRSSPSNTTT